MSDSNNNGMLGKIASAVTHISIICALPITILFGTAHLSKFDTELTLKAKLIGDTEILNLVHGEYGAPRSGQKFCYVEGRYEITNIGQYPFLVKSVSIELWEYPYITDSKLSTNKSISYALSERLKDAAVFPARPVSDTIDIPINETFGIGNKLQRSFGFIVPMSMDKLRRDQNLENSRYVVVANAKAELEQNDARYSQWIRFITGTPAIEFKGNDLRHMSETLNICGLRK